MTDAEDADRVDERRDSPAGEKSTAGLNSDGEGGSAIKPDHESGNHSGISDSDAAEDDPTDADTAKADQTEDGSTATDTTDGSTETGPTDGSTETGPATETPTPQAEALRQQQYYVAVGGGILAGFALMAGLYQRFPDAPFVVPVLAGVFGAAFVLWLAKRSVFPGEDELGEPR